MTLDNRPDVSTEITSIEQLVDLFRAAEKPASAFRVGMEHEKIGLLRDTLRPVPFAGPRGIEAVLRILEERLGFAPYTEHAELVALTKGDTTISLEPGGQFELSGAVLENNHQTCRELTEHRDLTRAIGEELGIVWLGVGHTPFATREEISWVPKTRYSIMRRYLPTRGHRALDMMLRTGTVQANYDWSDEADMVLKMRAATAVTSIVSALYANSAIVEGKTTGWVSERQRIWQAVDPDRCGLPTFVFEEGFGYRRYVEWALDVPMFFVRRGGEYQTETTGLTFRRFLREGHAGYRATISDWEDHLTTLFPEVRIKAYMEVRGADCCDRALNCAYPALWKGILYHRPAAEAAFELTADWSEADRRSAVSEVARLGLDAEVRGAKMTDLARELLAMAREGLIAHRALNGTDQDETKYLEPLDLLIEGGKSPGRIAADLWEGELAGDREALIAHYRF